MQDEDGCYIFGVRCFSCKQVMMVAEYSPAPDRCCFCNAPYRQGQIDEMTKILKEHRGMHPRKSRMKKIDPLEDIKEGINELRGMKAYSSQRVMSQGESDYIKQFLDRG